MANIDKSLLKERIKSEYEKCVKNPMYFFKKYVKIQNPVKGTVNFELYDFQEKALKDIVDNRYTIVLKARQMGISTLVSAYALYLMTFFKDKNILVISITQETAKEIVTRVRFANNNLPSWIKKEAIEDNRLSLRLSNGSQIKAVSSNSSTGRSAALSFLIIDECAFISNIDEIWTSAQPTLSLGGKACILSCVTGDTFVFTDKGIKQVKDFVPSEEEGDYVVKSYYVLGKDKLRTGNLFKVNGFQKTNIISCKFAELECTENHKLWAIKANERNPRWVKSEELTTNDYISIQYGMNVWGNNDSLKGFKPSISTSSKNIPIFNKITPDLAYFFGLYISEGCCVRQYNKDKKLIGGCITITCGDDVSWIFDKLGLEYHCHDKLHYNSYRKNLIELFKFVGFDLSKHAPEKYIPSKLLEMPKELIIQLLKGIFDGDGCADSKKCRVSLASNSKLLINQVRIILNNFGILSSVYKRDKDKLNLYKSVKHKFTTDSYVLEINGKFALRYFNLIGFNLKRKQDKLLNIHIANRKTTHDLIPFGADIVRNIVNKTGLKISEINKECNLNLNGICNKKKKYKSDYVTRSLLLILYNTYKHCLSNEEIELYDKIIDEHIYWCQIKSINHSQNNTYDFSLVNNKDDFWEHSVIYNGISAIQTPFGVASFFHKMWVEAESGANGFKPIKLPWYLHPDRDKAWRDEQTAKVGVKQAAQENDCEFTTTGDSVIPITILEKYENDKVFVKNPEEKRGQMQDLWIWERVQPGKSYIISADCARGDGNDFSAFQIFDMNNMEQVAEYKGKLTTKLYGNLLVALATEYNDALLVIENNNIGWATIQQVIDRNYGNLFYSSNNLTLVDTEKSYTNNWTAEDKKKVAGFTTTNQNRQLLINNMSILVTNMELKIHSIRLIRELSTFIWKDGKAQAMKGYNDDLVMSYSIGLWIRNTALRIKAEELSYQEAMLKSFKVSTTNVSQFKDSRQVLNGFNAVENNNNLFDSNIARDTWNFNVMQNQPIMGQSVAVNPYSKSNVLNFGINNNPDANFDLRELL